MSAASDPGLPPELVTRFKAALERLNPAGGKIGLAVSGGPDSMAMLLLAHAAIPGGFAVATVNHGLRAEAADECALVVAVCKERKIPCTVLTVEVGEGNMQSAARSARYMGLYTWAERHELTAIATAHHADDQAETLLMRLNRGSGVAGLAGIRDNSYPFEDRYDEVPVVRPLLEFRRAELRAVVATAGIACADDPSNRDESFDRVRIRKALAAADWLDPLALARSASYLADADRALIMMTNEALGRYVKRSGDQTTCVPPPEREVAIRVIGRIIEWTGGSARGSDIARLLDKLTRGEGGNLGGVLATVSGDHWLFRPEPPRRSG